MAVKTIKGSIELAESIKQRRNELDFTIDEAALKARVGTKTWSRYESGESIRKDKVKGICRALNWSNLPENEEDIVINISEYKKDKAWSSYISENYGEYAAASFVIGSEILLDELNEDMSALTSMPRGSHIGQLSLSWLGSLLPKQFLMQYDYEFLYVLHNTITSLKSLAFNADPIVAHSVIEELALYLIVEESRNLMRNIEPNYNNNKEDMYDYSDWDGWIYDVFDDMDIITFLYSDSYLMSGDAYHFDRWLERQFYVEEH